MGHARVTVLAVLAAAACAAPASAVPGPIEAPIATVTAVHPVTGLTQDAAGVSAGWIGEQDASFPRVGDVFYLRGLYAVTGTLPDVPILQFVADAALLPDMELAISAANPVRCLFYPQIAGPPAPDAPACAQSPEGTLADGAFFGSPGEMQPGQGFEVQVPVRVSRPKNGLASGREAAFGVRLRSVWGVALSVQHLIVPPAPAAGPAGGAPTATPPRATRLRAVVGRADRRGRRAVTVRLRLSAAAQLRVTLQRRARPGAPFRAMRRPAVTRRLAAGVRRVPLGRLAPGAYRAVLRMRGVTGTTSTARVTFRVR